MRSVDIRRVLYGAMPVGAWVTLQQLYGIVEDSQELKTDDYEQSSTPDGNEPRWLRDVRNVLQVDKETPRVDWNSQSSQYRLNEFVVGQRYPMRVITNKPEGGISHSNDGKSVVCITFPSDPNNLYSDAWTQAGYYQYGGTGRNGDQSFTGNPGHWNDKVRNHESTGLPIQLFERDTGATKSVTFLGNVTIDPMDPFKWVNQIDDLGKSRYVIQFHLWPEHNQPTNSEDDQHESEVHSRNDISDTEKSQLIMARRGQGLFRTRVSRVEMKCRITALSSPKHLRASHIKPWRLSSDQEKLDCYNGLLLSPHVDHLFDRGYISFTENGSLLVSSCLTNDVLEAWNIDSSLNVGNFLPEQEIYLKFHRDIIFKQ